MKNYKKSTLLLISILTVTMLFASNISDTSDKEYNEGYNRGYNIYPTPQREIVGSSIANISTPLNIVIDSEVDQSTIERAKQILNEHNIKFNISSKEVKNRSNLYLALYPSEMAQRKVSQLKLETKIFNDDSYSEKFDKHIISFSELNSVAQIAIIAENSDALFCALASIEQLLDQSNTTLRCGVIYDYADVRERGIIEGYYGLPYSAEVTKDLFRFMARFKMNTYMYGAKSDPYHSRYWKDPYPINISTEEEKIGYLSQDMMKDITNVARQYKINFVWAIHPGRAFADSTNTQIVQQIMGKFESMYNLGVRQFGIFVDDVGVPSDLKIMKLCADNLTTIQNLIDQKWNTPDTPENERVKPINYVPQLYAFSWVSREQGEKFFKSLSQVPKKVNIYITGENVWSVPNNTDIDIVRNWLGNNVSWWWNYVCNDQDVTKIFVGDMYTNFRDESHIISNTRVDRNLKGTNTVILNPMQQGELSKIGLFSVADYTWNTQGFNNEMSWEAAISHILGKKWENDFRVVAPYLRYYDSDAIGYLILRYKQSVDRGRPAPQALINELKRVNAAGKNLLAMENSSDYSDVLFYNDLKPWLKKLNAMTSEAIVRLENSTANLSDYKSVDYQNDEDFKFAILGGMGESISFAIRTAEPANESLLPFIQWLRER